jgi:hypothetical protein
MFRVQRIHEFQRAQPCAMTWIGNDLYVWDSLVQQTIPPPKDRFILNNKMFLHKENVKQSPRRRMSKLYASKVTTGTE